MAKAKLVKENKKIERKVVREASYNAGKDNKQMNRNFYKIDKNSKKLIL